MFDMGDVVTVQNFNCVGRVIKILSAKKRMVQYADFQKERFIIRQIEIEHLMRATDDDRKKLKEFAIEHNHRLKMKITKNRIFS